MGDFEHAVKHWGNTPLCTYTLAEDALIRVSDGIETTVPYRDIAGVRLTLSPGFPGPRRGCTVVRSKGPVIRIMGQHYVETESGLGETRSTAFRLMALMIHLTYREDRSETFSPLVRELLQGVHQANPNAKFTVGSTGWWLASTVLFLVFGALALLFAIALLENGKLAALGPIFVFGSLMPWLWPVMRTGWARSCDPAAPPRVFLRGGDDADDDPGA